MADGRLLTRVVLCNYKSIAACDVSPARLSFLVGPNGAGKSNFLDALRFVADAVRFSLDHALRDRGGINEVRRRSGGHPNHFAIRLDLDLAGTAAHYAFTVGARRRGGYEVKRELCVIRREDGSRYEYVVKSGRVVRSTLTPPPPATADRLYLVNASGVETFRPVYDALIGMGFYNLNPDAIRAPQAPDSGDLLKRGRRQRRERPGPSRCGFPGDQEDGRAVPRQGRHRSRRRRRGDPNEPPGSALHRG